MFERRSEAIQLFEAPANSDWFHAIEARNCKLLLELFQADRSLWVQTGLKGRSVLHVAVMQGCSELVKQLHDYKGDLIPRGKKWQTPFEFLWENAKDGRLKDASAKDMWIVMEGLPVEPDMVLRPDYQDRISLAKTDDQRIQAAIEYFVPTRYSRDAYLQSHVTGTKPVADDEMLCLREVITSIANKEAFVMDETDVDFNFEDVKRKELYVHMACSRMRKVHSKDDWESFGCGLAKFMIAVFTALDQEDKALLKKLFDQQDAQGRTILQIFVLPFTDVSENIEYPEPIKSFCETLQQALEILPANCVNVPDKAGRTLLHWAIAHNSLWAFGVIRENGKTNWELTFGTATMEDITAFHLQSWPGVVSQLLYFNMLQKELRKKLRVRGFQVTQGCQEDGTWDALDWAILMGRKDIAADLLTMEVIRPHIYIWT
jgi:ankyrin repeat protein